MSSSMSSRTATKIQEEEEKNRKRAEAKVDKFFIPEDREEWEGLARKAPCHNIFKLHPRMMASGSETTDAQFICYRALCTGLGNREDFDKEKASFGITDDIWDAAGKAMSESPELDKFLKLLHAGVRSENITEHDDDWPGSWVATKSFSEKITLKNTKRKREEAPMPARSASRSASSLLSSFPRPAQRGRLSSIFPTQQADYSWLSGDSHPSVPAQGKGTYPDVEDEQTVNTFAVLLLEQAGRLFGHHLSRWTMDRVPLKATFDTRNFRAYTDGALRPRRGPLIHAALVFKKSVRSSIPLQTTKQEISQIIGMIIGGHPPIFNEHWLLTAINRHEIYIKLSKYRPEYVAYLRTGNARKNPFLKTKSFGPWHISNVFDMLHIIHVFVSFTIIGNMELARVGEAKKKARTGK